MTRKSTKAVPKTKALKIKKDTLKDLAADAQRLKIKGGGWSASASRRVD